jgi:hypothetical protein
MSFLRPMSVDGFSGGGPPQPDNSFIDTRITNMQSNVNWVPTRKWVALLVSGFTPIALSAIDSGWDKTESKMAVVLVSGAIVSYFVPNAKP